MTQLSVWKHFSAAAVACVAAFGASAWASTQQWEPYPPGVGGPWGGSVRRVVSPGSPTNPADPLWDTLWAATGGGVYRSTDGGATWASRSTGLQGLDVTDIDVCRADPQRLIASTANQGVYLSSDDGGTWTRVDQSLPQVRGHFYRVAVNPNDPSHLFAATFQNTSSLLESTNGGATWTTVGGPGSSFSVSRLLFTASGEALLFATRTGRIFRYAFSGNPTALAPFPSTSSNVEILDFVLPGGGGAVIAAAQGGVGLWVSQDGGATWQERHFEGSANPDFHEVDAVAADPTDASRVLYHLNDPLAGAATSLYDLPLAGGTRTALALPESWMETLGVFATPATEWLLENKAGLFRRVGRTGAFSHSSRGLAAFSARDVAFAPMTGALAVAGGGVSSGNGGAYLWDPATGAWVRLAPKPTDPLGTSFPAASTNLARYRGAELWLGVEGWGIYRSSDQGATWSAANAGLPGTGTGKVVYGLEFSDLSPNLAVVGTGGGVFRTMDSGASWERAIGIPPSIGWAVARDIRSPSGILVVGKHLNDGLFFSSPDAGASWLPMRFLRLPEVGLPPSTAVIGQWIPNPGESFAAGDPVARYHTDLTSSLSCPDIGPFSNTATVASWAKPVRSTFLAGEAMVTIHVPTQEAPVIVPAPRNCRLMRVDRPVGSVVNTGDVLGGWAELFDIPATQAGILVTVEKAVDGIVNVGDILASFVESNPFRGAQLSCVAGSSRVPGHILVGTELFGLYESADGGASWSALGGGASGLAGLGKVTAVALADEPGDPWMAAAVSSVVYVTADGGNLWRERTEGLALPGGVLPLVYALRFDPRAPRLVAAVNNRGLWYLDLFPRVELSGVPASPTSSRGATIGVGGAEIEAYRSSLDGAGYGAEALASEPLSLSGLTDGLHRVEVIGRNAAGAWQPESNATAAQWTVDGTPPTGSVTINGGAAATVSASVTLAVAATDALTGVTGMRFSNDGAAYSATEPLAASKAWTLSAGDGTKAVYVQFADGAGNVATVTDTILLDTTIPDTEAPSGTVTIAAGQPATATASVTLALSASDDRGGPVEMCLGNDSGPCAAWEALAASKTWTLAAGDGQKTVYAWFRDEAGNVSAAASDAILLDVTAPTGGVTVNGGAATTTTANVTLTLSASDGAGSGAVEMRLGHDGTAWNSWEPLAASRAWVLTAGSGAKSVYVQFRDAVGHVSSAASAGIEVVDPPPAGGGGGGGGGCFLSSLGL